MAGSTRKFNGIHAVVDNERMRTEQGKYGAQVETKEHVSCTAWKSSDRLKLCDKKIILRHGYSPATMYSSPLVHYIAYSPCAESVCDPSDGRLWVRW